MLTRDLLELLASAAKRDDVTPEQRESIRELVTILAPHSDMELTSLFDLFRKAFKPKRGAGTLPPSTSANSLGRSQNIREFSNALKAAFDDDTSFARLIADAKPNRSLTIVALKSVFADLFGRAGNFRSKATRDDVLRKILDERNIQVRNEQMGKMLGRKPVTVE